MGGIEMRFHGDFNQISVIDRRTDCRRIFHFQRKKIEIQIKKLRESWKQVEHWLLLMMTYEERLLQKMRNSQNETMIHGTGMEEEGNYNISKFNKTMDR